MTASAPDSEGSTPRDDPPDAVDPLLARTVLALLAPPVGAVVRANDRPYRGEVQLVLDAARLIVVLRAGERDPAAVAARLAALQTELPRTAPLDLVVLGGGEAVRKAVRRAPPAVMLNRTVGVAHLSDAGELFASRLDARVRDALTRVEVSGAAPDPAVMRAAIAESYRRGAAQFAELDAFNAALRARRPYVTGVLVATNVLVFGLELLWGGPSAPTLVRMGANVPALVAQGEVWRLLAHAFLHGSAMHLGFNMIALWSFGAFFEKLLGPARVLVLYALAALGGGAATVLASGATLTVGASGAIFGFLGAAAALALRPGDTLPTAMRPAFRRNIAINLGLQLMISQLPNVSLSAHLGGALVGFALLSVRALRPRAIGAAAPPDAAGGGGGARATSAAWLAAAALATAALAVAPVWAIARGAPWAAGRLAWQRHALAGTPWSVELPGAPRPVQRHDESREFVVGDLSTDGYLLELVAHAAEQPIARAEAEQAVRDLATAREGLDHPRDGAADGPPETREVGGQPAVVQRFHAARGPGRFVNWVQVRARGSLSVQMIYRADAGAQVGAMPERILASVRER